MVLRIVLFTVTFLFITLMFWAGGFDFDERGFVMVMWLYVGVGFSGLVAFIPRGKS